MSQSLKFQMKKKFQETSVLCMCKGVRHFFDASVYGSNCFNSHGLPENFFNADPILTLLCLRHASKCGLLTEVCTESHAHALALKSESGPKMIGGALSEVQA